MARSERPYRRRKEPLLDPQQLGYTVTGRSKRGWEDLAALLKVSPSALFAILVQNLPLDDYGRPTWLPEPPTEDGVLQMPAA